MSLSKLFQAIQVGDMTLKHRVVLPPLTRNRASSQHVHGDIAVEYYRQRASEPGTLLISEATFIAAKAGGFPHVPGIWNKDQIAAWKKVTDAVHHNDSFIYAQLWAMGRGAEPTELQKEGFEYIGASDIALQHDGSEYFGLSNIPLIEKPKPRALTTSEVKEYVELFGLAAKNAVEDSGFDGVEIHGGGGFLIAQFLSDVVNNRTDQYGGSIENRARFGLEVLEACIRAVGASKVGIRLCPWETFNETRLQNPVPQYAYFVKQIVDRYPDLAYVHVTEPRLSGNWEIHDPVDESNDFIREIWAPRPLISAGGYSRELAIEVADTKGDLIGFGRAFIANPDLPRRLREDIPLNKYDRSTFYTFETAEGYTDYPFSF